MILDGVVRDLQTALRSLRSSRASTATIVATLALAIGANTVIFSAVEAVLFRPLPVHDVDRIVAIGHRVPAGNLHGGLQAAEVFHLEDRHDLFDAIAGYRNVDLDLTGAGAAERIPAVTTTGEFFDVFGMTPYLGHFYRKDDGEGPDVVVLSFDLWHTLTGGDVAAVGRPLRLNDSSYRVIGVAPPGFEYPLGAQLWTPKTLDVNLDRTQSEGVLHGGSIVPTVARMTSGMTLPRLQNELKAALRTWSARQPQFYTQRAPRPIEAREFVTAWAGQLRPILVLLIGAVALVLIISCANVGSLQLLRVTGRGREIAVRMAVGGSRAAIVRQFATETAVLAALGGIVGVLFAKGLIVSVGRMIAGEIPELHALHLDLVVLACSAAVTILAAVIFGLGPALRAASADPREAMAAAGSRSQSSGLQRNRFLRGAVVVQVGLALLMVLMCAVATVSVRRLLAVDPGFDASHIVTARLTLPPSRYGDESTHASVVQILSLHERLLAALRATPGVEAASATDAPPFGYRGVLDAAVHHTAAAAAVGPAAAQTSVLAATWFIDADYFRTMGIPLRAGRGFTGHEVDDQVASTTQLENDVVIDERLAHRLFPAGDAIGKLLGPWSPGFRVIGIVGSVRQSDLRGTTEDEGAIYFVNATTQPTVTILLRTRLPFGTASTLLRNAVHSLDPELTLYGVEPMPALVRRSVGPRQVASWLLLGLAGLSLILAVLGVFGVLSYTTAHRMNEMGIRMALGATPGEVLGLVARGALTMTIAGAALGVLGYLGMAPSLAAIAFGVDVVDPTMIAIAVCALMLAALLAAMPAAIRAARVDPARALRAE